MEVSWADLSKMQYFSGLALNKHSSKEELLKVLKTSFIFFFTSKSRLNSCHSFLMSFEPACLSLTAYSYIAAGGDGCLNIHFDIKFKARVLYWSMYILFHGSIYKTKGGAFAVNFSFCTICHCLLSYCRRYNKPLALHGFPIRSLTILHHLFTLILPASSFHWHHW